MQDALTMAQGGAYRMLAAASRLVGTLACRAGGRFDELAGKLTLRTFGCALVALMAVFATVSAIAAPTAASAIPDETGMDPGLGIDPVAYTIAKEGIDYDTLTKEMEESDNPIMRWLLVPFTTVTNGYIDASHNLVRNTADTSVLTASFNEINPGIYSVVQGVHKTAVIPLANVVALIVFTIGLVKVFANSSSTEQGIDLWKIMLIFLAYGATMIIINTSWEIMVGLYTLMQKVLATMAGNLAATPSSSTVTGAAAKNPGMAMFTMFLSLFVFIAVAASCLVINVMVLARGIEIYMYACYSPVAFAFMVTEGGRQMTEAFLKRYAAVLLAGAIQMVLMIVFAMSVAQMGDPGAIGDADGVGDWVLRYLTSFIWVFVCAFMMTRATTLAKDIIGTN